MSGAQYDVVKQFKYAGKTYKKGDVWSPAGYPNDDWLASNQKYVVLKKTKAQKEAERAEYVKHQQEKHDTMTGKKKAKPTQEDPPKPKPQKPKRKARKKKK